MKSQSKNRGTPAPSSSSDSTVKFRRPTKSGKHRRATPTPPECNPREHGRANRSDRDIDHTGPDANG